MLNLAILGASLILLGISALRLNKLIHLGTVMHHYVYIFKLNVIYILSSSLLLVASLFGVLYPVDYMLLPLSTLIILLLNHSMVKAFTRLGNLPTYVVVVYSTMHFIALMYPISKVLLVLWTLTRLNQTLINLLGFLIVFGFWFQLYRTYKKPSFIGPMIIAAVSMISHIILGTLSYHLLPIFAAYTVVIYLYIEFIHPLPTLFDKYVFDKPVHKFWQFLLGLSTIIILIL